MFFAVFFACSNVPGTRAFRRRWTRAAVLGQALHGMRVQRACNSMPSTGVGNCMTLTVLSHATVSHIHGIDKEGPSRIVATGTRGTVSNM